MLLTLHFASIFPHDIARLFQQISPFILTKWIIIAGLCAALIALTYFSHSRERKYYKRLASHATNADTAALDYSLRLLSQSARNYFLFSISFIILLFCVIFYDIKQHHLVEVNQLKQNVAACETRSIQASSSPAESPAPSEEQATVIPQNAPLNRNQEAELDELKRTYEKAYINFFLLYHCKQAPFADYALMNAALTLQLSPYQQTQDFIPLVQQAAQGTYQELYSTMQCNDAALSTSRQQHQQFLDMAKQTVQKNLTPSARS